MKLKIFISNKVKKVPSELITGNSDSYRFRKDLTEIYEKQKPQPQLNKFGQDQWYFPPLFT